MPITNYYTLEDEILGQELANVRTDYLTDGIGSVTGTQNDTAAVVNTYRFKPYGSLLSKVGSGSDPRFKWIGTRGYAFTGRAASDYYVRARHYSSASSRWISTDPLWPEEPAYGYASASPVVGIDPTGRRNIRVSIDDGPENYSTPKYLAAFKRWNIKVAFFVIGRHVVSSPSLAIRMKNEGHILANHTNCHSPQPFCAGTPTPAILCDGFSAPTLTLKEMRKQWCDCDDIVKKITGVQMNRFRSPGGSGWIKCPKSVFESASVLRARGYGAESTGAGISDAGGPVNWAALQACAARGRLENCKDWATLTVQIDGALREIGAGKYNNIFFHQSHEVMTVDFIDDIFRYITSKKHRLVNF